MPERPFGWVRPCARHAECGRQDWCDDKNRCQSCSKWDPHDVHAAIGGIVPPSCNGGPAPAWRPSELRYAAQRVMSLCASCHADISGQPAPVCLSISGAVGRTIELTDVDCTERYTQFVRCAGRTFLFSRIEHYNQPTGERITPHWQVVAREANSTSTRNSVLGVPRSVAFGRAAVAVPEDKAYAIATNAAIVCLDERLHLYGGGDGGVGVTWSSAAVPPRSGVPKWASPQVIWSGARASTGCVDVRNEPKPCEYDGKLSVTRFGKRVLAFTRANHLAKGGRHVQLASSPDGRGSWSRFRCVFGPRALGGRTPSHV